MNKNKLKPFLEINHLTKSLNSKNIIDNINLIVNKGEIFALLGPSGCGKSTLLRVIAGFEKIKTGKILLEGKDISNIPPYKRNINMMFQSYALFPHMTVKQNIIFGLKQEKLKKNEINARTEEMLNLVKMHEYANYKPNQLSGGQCQRAALARSLAKKPKLLLLDEPMGSIDKKLRNFIQLEIIKIIKNTGITCIIVTHDQKEAMLMSKRIGIMNHGKFEQIGSPEDIYENPNNLYCAKFIGSINVFKGLIIKKTKNNLLIKVSDFNSIIEVKYTNKKLNNIMLYIALRPEKIMICNILPNNVTNFTIGKIIKIAYLGDLSIYYTCLKSGQTIISQVQNNYNFYKMNKPLLGDKVYLYWDTESCILLNM